MKIFREDICAHSIECHYDEDLPCDELPESEYEHIQECLIDGYHSGELCYVDEKDHEYRGWWGIEDKTI